MCYAGNILKIDLSKEKGEKQKIGESFILKYLGGDGFGAYFMNKEVDARIDAFSPDNALIIAPGLFVGTAVPTAGKTSFFSKSALTNGWNEGVMGGRIGFEMKQAGYDAIIVKGKAKELSYIVIRDDEVKINSAEHLRGETTRKTAEEIKKDEGVDVVATIGIAGENLVRFAIVDCDERQAGRGGIGAVMGSKNLKAIAVEGTKDIKISKPEKLLKLAEEWYEKMISHPSFEEDGKYGTGEFLEWMNSERGTFPTRNWREGIFDERKEIDPYYWAPKYAIKNKACTQCVKPCGKAFVARDFMLDGVEYETLFALGSNCGVASIEHVAKANELCDLYGMDTISAGGVVGFLMDLYENGIIKKDEIGFEAKFGDGNALLELIKMIANREGIGNLLAEGVKMASKKIKGSEKYAVHVRGLEPPAYDVRGIKGMGLAFMSSPRGACHLRSGAYALELTGKFWKYEGVDRFSSKNKGKEIADMENFMAIYDALGVCKFSRKIFLLNFEDLLDACIGKGMKEDELLLIGERICNLKHIFNIKAGWKKGDCKLPEKMHIPIPEGVSKGSYISKEEEKEMLDDYFKARGWRKDGIPKKDKIKELEIEEFWI
ncbi:MAG: aldehyde ferredoxin oxidoreductase family protein [Thermoplasmatales archaeon]|nr:aldehyde ferredoxin oxidoreductase family protein [Thermoplasmatales archaeon]